VSALPIRIRLMLVFAVAMACVIGTMAALVYLRVGSALLTSVDQTLRAQARESLAHAHNEQELVDPDTAGGRTLAELYSANGKRLRSTAATPRLLGREDALASAGGRTFFRTESLPGLAGRWRVLAVAAPNGGAIVVARSLAERDDALHRISRELLIAGPLAVLLASIAGYALAAAALRPVEAMRRRAAIVSAAAPGTLPVPPARDEISRLAVTLNEMLTRLQASLEHERRFVADASHELRTPVALLRTELELALRRPRSPDELKLALRSALVETERLSRLADDLLLLARSQDGSLPIRVERTEVSAVFDAVTGRFVTRARETGRALRAEPTSAVLNADPNRLEQALDNLVENAFAYGAGEVRISSEESNEWVDLHVTDCGSGFDDRFLDRAFDRFSRSDDVRGHSGAGLGLSIVQVIAEAHGGGARAANRAGGGADVWLTLPRSGPPLPSS
jgi:two-component system, OmpR family, sensor kinase